MPAACGGLCPAPGSEPSAVSHLGFTTANPNETLPTTNPTSAHGLDPLTAEKIYTTEWHHATTQIQDLAWAQSYKTQSGAHRPATQHARRAQPRCSVARAAAATAGGSSSGDNGACSSDARGDGGTDGDDDNAAASGSRTARAAAAGAKKKTAHRTNALE